MARRTAASTPRYGAILLHARLGACTIAGGLSVLRPSTLARSAAGAPSRGKSPRRPAPCRSWRREVLTGYSNNRLSRRRRLENAKPVEINTCGDVPCPGPRSVTFGIGPSLLGAAPHRPRTERRAAPRKPRQPARGREAVHDRSGRSPLRRRSAPGERPAPPEARGRDVPIPRGRESGKVRGRDVPIPRRHLRGRRGEGVPRAPLHSAAGAGKRSRKSLTGRAQALECLRGGGGPRGAPPQSESFAGPLAGAPARGTLPREGRVGLGGFL
jgi:hypothetical protein